MRVAIIPTRKGSARTPGKNTARVGCHSLVERAVEQALRTGLYDQIIVTTNDPEVMALVEGYPVTIHVRDPKLAGENSPLIAVIAHVIHNYDLPEDTVVTLLVVTNPLRTDADIRSALHIFESGDRRHTLVSVCEMENPIEMTWRLGPDGLLHQTFETKTTRKQDFPPAYRWNDALVIDAAGNFTQEGRKLYGANPIPFIMPPERSFCIDYPWQLRIVKLLMENTNHDQNT